MLNPGSVQPYPINIPQTIFDLPILYRHNIRIQWIGLRENLQENPIFNWKIDGFL